MIQIPSPAMKSFLTTGKHPQSQREVSAILDEARSLLIPWKNGDIGGRVAQKKAIAESMPANWTPPETAQQVEKIKRDAEAAKAQREQAQRDLEKKHAEQAKKMASSQPPRRDRYGRSYQDEPMEPAKPAPKAAAPAPAPAPVSATPLGDEFARLQGAERTAFYRKNERLLRREQILARYPRTILPPL
jgi:hypothetical protein